MVHKLKFIQSFGSKTAMDECTWETKEPRRKFPIKVHWRSWM